MKQHLIDEDMDRSHIDQLLKKQMAIAGHTVDDRQSNQYINWSRSITDMVPGLAPSATNPDQQDRYNRFTGQLMTEVENFERDNNKRPTRQDVIEKTQQIIQSIYTGEPKASILGYGIGRETKRRFEIDVPDAARNAIEDAHQKANPNARPLTEDQIRNRYWHIKNFQ